MKKSSLIALTFGILVIAALVYTTLGNRQFRCEVCITYNGKTQCRIASARTRETAQRTASELACSEMEGNMADRIRCPNTPPDSVTWK
jgi:hypothetical protein